jgi:hypothetical protein
MSAGMMSASSSHGKPVNEPTTMSDKDVLIVVDIQSDFCAGGALAVPHGDDVVRIIDSLAARFHNVVLAGPPRAGHCRGGVSPRRVPCLATQHFS